MARGELRVYLGAAAGVGKTYAMLNEGRRRRDYGEDVVIGFVEPHRRAKTAAQIGDLEVVEVPHRDGTTDPDELGEAARETIDSGQRFGREDVAEHADDRRLLAAEDGTHGLVVAPVGVVVGIIIIAMYLPMFKLLTLIQ